MSQADSNEDLQEQIISLRELIEGYRESHRSLFRQVKEANAAQQQTEELFWSLVARAEARHHKHPTLPEADPFGELEELPPAPTTPSPPPPPPFDAERARRTEELETKVLQLMREVSRLRGANDELVWQMEAQEKTYQQAALAAAAALEHQIADARRERAEEIEQAHAAELAFQEQQYAHKSSELARVSDKLRLVSVDLELAKCQIEEDAEEIANLQKKIKALQSEAAPQRPAARSLRATAPLQVPSALQSPARPQAVEAPAPITQPLPQPVAAQGSARSPAPPARPSPAATEPASARPAPASSRSVTAPQGPPSMRPPPLHTAAKPFPDDLGLPLVQPTGAPSAGLIEDDDGEHVNEDELLIGTAPPPVAVPLPVASTAPASESRPRSARPPPLPSSSVPDLPASPPPPATEGARNRTQGWSSAMNDPFPAPVAAAKPSRNRTMLGFEANPDQLAKQRKLAEEASSDVGEKGSRSKR